MKYKITLNRKVYEVEVEQGEATLLAEYEAALPALEVAIPSPDVLPVSEAKPAAAPSPVDVAEGEAINAPLPGTITDVKVSVGDVVNAGDLLVVIEAMKMANELFAPRGGKVVQIAVSTGTAVSTGALLLVLA